ncbi:MAG: acyl-CoA dehydrogenase [Gammaproteobacteria bacterium]|nr:MAG: acyl-CoA dehydrogenase [Gammaproteobacteria bacterium]
MKLKSTMTFSEEQGMLLDTATEFFRDKSSTAHVRDLMLSEHGYDPAVWQEMVALGWSGLAIPEACGGSDLGLAAAVTIAEPMGRHLSATPWLPTQLFIQGILAGGEDLAARLLPAVAEGAIGTVALSEVDGDWDLANARLTMSEADGGVSLSGTKTFVLNADVADYLLVSGSLNGEPALAVLAREELPTGAVQRETVIDETRRSFELCLGDVFVPAERLIQDDTARAALTAIRDAALLLISAEAAGGIAGVLEVIVDYLNTRTAFGRKIGSYQGLKHPTVDILIGLERSRSHVYHAASLIEAGESPEQIEVALRMAKAEASDAYAFAGDRGIQFHGGFGFTWECDAQLYLRRALWAQYAFGDAIHHRRHLADALL